MGSESKGGGGGSKSLDYFGTIAGVVCMGTVEYLAAVLVDGKEVWPGAKAWKSGVAIALNENRRWGGRTWFALSAHTSSGGNAPPNPAFWSTFYASRGVANNTSFTIPGYG